MSQESHLSGGAVTSGALQRPRSDGIPGEPGIPTADAILLGFTSALRAAGVPVTSDRAQAYLAAVAIVGLGDRAATRAAGRATLCAGPDDLARHDEVFEAWFGVGDPAPDRQPRPRAMAPTVAPALGGDDAADDTADTAPADPVHAAASQTEVLRHRDVADLDAAERRRLAALFGTLRPRPPRRRTARREAWRRGEVDATRTLRTSLRRMGEPAQIAWRRRGSKPRPVVLLVDVSGSMAGYADALLRLAHRMVVATGSTSGGRARVEVFTIGTRLTHLTRALRRSDPDRALAAAGEVVPDWSGGTRLGEALQAFLVRWGRRGLARGAVVVVFSDGWERGDVTLLADQVAQLQRLAHRVVWVNPHRGKDGYEPVQAGISAVLPHVDDFLAGHSLATFAELLEVVRRA